MERLMIVARLASGANADAERLIANGPPFDPEELGFHRHFVFLTATEVVFLFEGPAVEWVVDDLVNDPVTSAAFSAWRPLLDGPPRLAHEKFGWTRPSLDPIYQQET
jgi:hypothetical protein